MATGVLPPKDGRSNLPSPNSTASFWHSEPSEFLLGHRTTCDLPSIADIVIVGSGITGSSIARFLAEDERANGKTIVMLEAREACWGATGRVSLQSMVRQIFRESSRLHLMVLIHICSTANWAYGL